MLGRGTAGAGLVHAATGQQRHNGQHLGAGAEFEDREQVRQVIAQHVAGHRNGVLPGANPLHGGGHRGDRGQDPDVQPAGVVILEIGLYLLDQLPVVGALLIQPEDGRLARRAGAVHPQLHPVADRQVLRLAHAPDVALGHLVLGEHLALGIDHADGARGAEQEGLVVRAVFLGRLGHQADVADVAHGGHVVGAVAAAVIDHRLVHAGIAPIGDQGLHVMRLAVRAPHAPRGADCGGHAGVDDHIAGHVQVGDALVRVHHRQRRPRRVGRLQVRLDLCLLRRRQGLDLGVHIADAVVRVHAELAEQRCVLVEDILVVHRDGVTEHDRVGDLHHGRLQMQRQQQTLGLRVLDLGLVELPQLRHLHEGRADELGGLHLDAVLQHRHRAGGIREFDAHGARRADQGGLLVAIEIPVAHAGHVGRRIRLPGAHRMRVGLRVVLDRIGHAPVGVALAQHRVDGAAEHLGEARLELLLRIVLRIFRILRYAVTLGVQLGDRGLQLRQGRRDVRQLDDVRFRGLGQRPQLRQVIGLALLLVQIVREICDDTAGQGDIPRLHGDPGAAREGLHDGQQGISRQRGRLIGQRVDDLGGGHVGSEVVLLRMQTENYISRGR